MRWISIILSFFTPFGAAPSFRFFRHSKNLARFGPSCRGVPCLTVFSMVIAVSHQNYMYMYIKKSQSKTRLQLGLSEEWLMLKASLNFNIVQNLSRGRGVTAYSIYDVVRMCVTNSPLFQLGEYINGPLFSDYSIWMTLFFVI